MSTLRVQTINMQIASIAQFRYLTNLVDDAVHRQPSQHVQLMLNLGVLSSFLFDTWLCTAATTSAFESVFLSSNTSTDAVPVKVVLGPTAVCSSPLALASPAQQKQLNIHVHPACYAGQLPFGMIYRAASVLSLPVHHLFLCIMS